MLFTGTQFHSPKCGGRGQRGKRSVLPTSKSHSSPPDPDHIVQVSRPVNPISSSSFCLSPNRRSQDWTLTSPKNLRSTHLYRTWEDSSRGHPLLPSAAVRPPPPGPPQLRDNSLLLGGRQDLPAPFPAACH